MTTPKSKDREWLAAYEAELARRNTVIDAIDRRKLAIDKRARRLEVAWAKIYVRRRARLIKELDARGITEQQWCRRLGKGFAYSTIMRRIPILKGHPDYVRRRDKVGDNGCYGLIMPRIWRGRRSPRTQRVLIR